MKLLVLATPAPQASKQTIIDGYVCAAIFTVLAVAQLFDFEALIAVFETNGFTSASILASLSVVGLVFSLPFLLRMYLSPLMRMTSLGLGIVTVLGWIGIALFSASAVNTGLLGGIIELDAFATLVIMGVLLCLLVFVAAGSAKRLS